MLAHFAAWMIGALAFTTIPIEALRKGPSVLLRIHRTMASLIMIGKLVNIDLQVTYRAKGNLNRCPM